MNYFLKNNFTKLFYECDFEKKLNFCVNKSTIIENLKYEYDTVHTFLYAQLIYTLVLIPTFCTIGIILSLIIIKVTQKYKEIQDKAKKIKQDV